MATSERSEAARLLGSAKSPRKTAAARENGRKGGRPRQDADILQCVGCGRLYSVEEIFNHYCEPPLCRLCGGEGVSLGLLGSLPWFRCRQCGIDFNLQPKED